MKSIRRWKNITHNIDNLVVDVNVIISASLNRGDSLNVFLYNFQRKKFNFIAPQFLLIEIGKHTDKIAEKTKLSSQETLDILEFIINQISFIDDNNFKDKLNEARNILGEHRKDVPYLALALEFGCNILSGDKILKQLCPEKVRNPKEILQKFIEN